MTLESDTPSGFERVFDLEGSGEPPVIMLCNMILSEALAANSTAISLVSTSEGCLVRYQVADQWHEVMKIPPMASGPLVNRLRVMANLDRTKGHTRQAGVVRARFQGSAFVFRVEVEPKPDGMEDAILHCSGS